MTHVEPHESAAATIAAQLTPAGRSALATIGIYGPRALEAVGRCFRAAGGEPLNARLPGAVVYGVWSRVAPAPPPLAANDGHAPAAKWAEADRDSPHAAATSVGEDVVVTLLSDKLVEVHGHGGSAAPARILTALGQLGVREVGSQQFLAAQGVPRYQRAAMDLLGQSRTRKSAEHLLDQWHGALWHKIAQIERDFREGHRGAAIVEVQRLLNYRGVAEHLVDPWRVLLAGPPNVGKSSLLNRLAGFPRAVVFAQPGTTRDMLTVRLAFEGWPVEVIDTAGIRHTQDELEAAGIARTLAAIAEADLVILLVDGQSLQDPQFCQWEQLALSHAPPGRRLLRAVNKCDLLTPAQLAALNTQLEAGGALLESVPISALTGQGLPELLQAVVHSLVPHDPPAGCPLPFLPGSGELLAQTLLAAQQGDWAAVQRHLAQLRSCLVGP